MSHACVHLNYKRNLLKKADGLRKRKHGLISPLTWPIFDGKAVFNERNIHSNIYLFICYDSYYIRSIFTLKNSSKLKRDQHRGATQGFKTIFVHKT